LIPLICMRWMPCIPSDEGCFYSFSFKSESVNYPLSKDMGLLNPVGSNGLIDGSPLMEVYLCRMFLAAL